MCNVSGESYMGRYRLYVGVICAMFQYLRSNLDQSFSKLGVSFGFMSYDNILTGRNKKVKFQDKEEIFQNKEITIDKLDCKVDTVTKSLSAQKHPTRLAVSTQFYEVFLLW